jgi:predicted O-methyltransferase YrrM
MEDAKVVRAQQVLDEIYTSNKVQDKFGNQYILNSNIDKEEGKFLKTLIEQNNFQKTIEVGCAYGISSLFICGALKSENSFHTIIDPFQSTDWNDIGITQLQRAGVQNYNLIEKYSEVALPELMYQGSKFDFAFVDGWHTFDHTLLDMFYLNRMLEVGGIMVIDDVGMKGVEKAVNYFLNYPAYKFIGGIQLKSSRKRDWFTRFIIRPLRFFAQIFPSKVTNEVFSSTVVNQGITGYSMVALKKIREDERHWNWYKSF